MRRRRTFPTILFALSGIFTLLALTGLQATGPTAGPRLLGRLGATLFELERWTPQHRDDLRAAARDRAFGAIEVRGLPIQVTLPVAVALEADDAEMSASLASEVGGRLYRDGRAAFLDSGAPGDISLTEPARWAIGLLEREDHALWKVAFGAGILALALSGVLMLLATSSGAAGMLRAVAAAGITFTLGCGAAWALTQAGGTSGGAPLDREIARIVADCAIIGLRAGLATAGAALVVLLMLRLAGQRGGRYQDWPGALDEAAS